jgi:hypothetical protein
MTVKLWLVGQTRSADGTQWEFQGIFDSEERAVEACRHDSYFVADALLNNLCPDENFLFPCCYYPHLETRAQGIARHLAEQERRK